jgi:starvation-inducible DNA-binding protein
MSIKISENLNKYLADTSVMYVKVHNLHWNVSGLQFKAVHEFLETIYDGLAENLDEIAELIKMNGDYPLASMAEYLKVSSINELSSQKYGVKESLEILLEDLKTLDSSAKEIRAAADEKDAFDIVSMMEEHCASYQKTIWFIESMLEK